MRKTYAKVGFLLYLLLLPFFRPHIRRSTRVYVAINLDGRVLLVKNWLARDTWRLAGGGVKKNESLESAAVREIEEELGFTISTEGLKQISSGVLQVDSLGARYSIFSYELQKSVGIRINKFEIIDWEYFESIPNSMHPDFARAVANLLKN